MKSRDAGGLIVNPWVQITGHADGFIPFDENRKVAKAMKANDRNEFHKYSLIDETDDIQQFLPQFHGLITTQERSIISREGSVCNGEWFVLTNVLIGYRDPVVIDIKMGKDTCGMRQFNVKMTRRNDLFRKFLDLGFPYNLLTEEEKEERAITKFRYAELRDLLSTSSKFGFRVEAMNTGNFAKKDYAVASSLDHTLKFINEFVRDCSVIQLENIISRLEAFQRSVKMSNFCQTHQLIGSSLFIAFDRADNCEKSGLWLIDLFQATKTRDSGHADTCQSDSIVVESHGDTFKEKLACQHESVEKGDVGTSNSQEESNDDVLEGAAMLTQLFETALTNLKSRNIIAV